MMGWLALSGVRRAPRRVLLGALAASFPVALLGATLLYVDVAVHSMTEVALKPSQVEMRALATSLDADMSTIGRRLAAVPGVRGVDRFAATDVVVGQPGRAERSTARLFAVDAGYLRDHPWIKVASGSFDAGALPNAALLSSSGLAAASSVTIGLPSGAKPLVSLPVGGVVDLRSARTWFAIPTGEVQGDIAAVPRAIVIDYATFDRAIRPALVAALGPSTPVLNPGLQDLPPVDIEAHISVNHAAYPTDPGQAVAWSAALQRLLERQATGQIVVADDAAEVLTMAKDDARNAKILFLLLGIPGVLAATGLGLAAESALTEAHRREEALLRLRGATDRQLVQLVALQTAVAGALGAALGVAAAIGAVSVVTGGQVWHEVPASRLAVSVGAAVLAGVAVVGIRIGRVAAIGRRSQVATDRRVLERGWSPQWRGARLDVVAIAAGLAILLINALTGGLHNGPVEGPPLALFFYVLLAPIALWLGLGLLATRALVAGFARWSRPVSRHPLTSWRGTTLRWLGRRPARAAVALGLGTLAVAFGIDVLSFTSTYAAATQADARAAFGADLRLTPATETPTTPPALPDVTATTPIRFVPARVGSDRKNILTLDLTSYDRVSGPGITIVSGHGSRALAGQPNGVLVAPEIATGFAVGPGDVLPVTLFPDDVDKSRNVNLHVVGVFLSAAPTSPLAEMVMSTAAVPSFALAAPETYLARVADGKDPRTVAAALRRSYLAQQFQVTSIGALEVVDRRSLTALSLAGLSWLEAWGAVLTAAIGMAVLGAFVVLERKREYAVLRTIGARSSHVLTGPIQEGVLVVVCSLGTGVPIGIGLAALSVRVLALFFALPPPVVAVPLGVVAGFVLLVLATSMGVMAGTLIAVERGNVAAVLREP